VSERRGDLGRNDFEEAHVEVAPPELVIAIGGVDLDRAFGDIKQRDIESAPAKVIDEDVMDVRLLVQIVCHSRSCWLFDNANDLRAVREEEGEGRDL
jgi:hypothetical protein